MPTQRTYPRASAADPVTRADLVCILDSHGLRFTDLPETTVEARQLRRVFDAWVLNQGIRPGLSYVMPLRTIFDLLSARHAGPRNRSAESAWRVLVNAINDPASGLQIVQRAYACQGRRRAA